jgi:dUTP pyrophosphatase
MLSILVQRLPHAVDLPTYSTPLSAGMDLFAGIPESITLKPGERQLIPSGIKIELPEGYEAQIRSRSGLAYKEGIIVLNSPGTIDADYRGEIKVLIAHLGQKPFVIQKGFRIAQLVVTSHAKVSWQEVDDLSKTTRQEGGFGSTGI